MVDARETRTLLEAYGLPLVPERLAGSPDEAVEAALALGLPVAVKSAVPGAHKTETGGVALGLGVEDEVRVPPSGSAVPSSSNAWRRAGRSFSPV